MRINIAELDDIILRINEIRQCKNNMNKIISFIDTNKKIDNGMIILEKNINDLSTYFNNFYIRYCYDMHLKQNYLKYLMIQCKIDIFYKNYTKYAYDKQELVKYVGIIKYIYYLQLLDIMKLHDNILAGIKELDLLITLVLLVTAKS